MKDCHQKIALLQQNEHIYAKEDSKIFKLRLIDFANIHYDETDSRPDEDLIMGIENLEEIFQ